MFLKKIYLLCLDNEKAFDRVSHHYLLKFWLLMVLVNSFIRWVSLLYTNSFSSVLVNGFVSDPFVLQRGVHQGCPLSPLLYVLSLEPLLCKIRSVSSVHGFSLPGTSFVSKLSAYVDGVTLTLISSKSVLSVLNICNNLD